METHTSTIMNYFRQVLKSTDLTKYSSEPICQTRIQYQSAIRFLPVISAGCWIPNRAQMEGATSANLPSVTFAFLSPT